MKTLLLLSLLGLPGLEVPPALDAPEAGLWAGRSGHPDGGKKKRDEEEEEDARVAQAGEGRLQDSFIS